MAHGKDKRSHLRTLFVYKRLDMEAACLAAKVPRSTANRWKAEAARSGDDWETARSAVALGAENFKHQAMRLFEDYLVQHQAVMDVLKADKTMDPLKHAQVIASLSDSMSKTRAAMKGISEEVDKQTVAADVLQRFSVFAQRHFPNHVHALIEMLEPFGIELSKAYG